MFSNRYIWAFFLIFFILIDTVFLKNFNIYGARTDFAFLLVVFAGLTNGILFGCGVGFAAGLVKDIFLNVYLGPGSFSFTIIGFLAGFFGKKFFYQYIIIQVLIVFIATVLKFLIINILSVAVHISGYCLRDIVAQAFCNSFFAPALFHLLGIIFKR
jgi:rod shape-determining protein MreD